MAAKVKKGDRVIVLSGRSKGVEGEVLKMMPAEGRCLVRGVNVVKRHTKPTQDDPQGGIRSFEAPIDVSNVALLDPRSCFDAGDRIEDLEAVPDRQDAEVLQVL